MREYQEPQTLFEQEQRDKTRKERTALYQVVMGKKNIPRLVQGLIVNTLSRIDPIELLKLGKYFRLENGSWEKRIDPLNRYHAYILPGGLIEIHTDTNKWIGNKKVHVASRYLVKEERKRLKALIPHAPSSHIPKIDPDVLPREARLEALAKLKDSPIIRRVPLWQKWISLFH